MKKRKIPNATCESCMNMIPIGEGDHACMEDAEPRIVLWEYAPTEEYCWCGGRFYEEK